MLCVKSPGATQLWAIVATQEYGYHAVRSPNFQGSWKSGDYVVKFPDFEVKAINLKVL